jgi:DNA polymerase
VAAPSAAARSPEALARPAPRREPERPLDPHERATRLPVLAQKIAGCTKCVLSETRTQTVFARGNPASSICFIGEAPGADEDREGLPFVGRAGQLLDRMIQAMGLDPQKDVYVVNILRCRPPGNRRPEPEEVAACMPYLQEQLDLVKPKVIVALGNTAASALTGSTVGITRLRGQWKLYRGTTLLMPTYHPSYLLRPGPQQALAKRQAWEDLQAVLRELGLPIPTPKKKRDDSPTDEEPT